METFPVDLQGEVTRLRSLLRRVVEKSSPTADGLGFVVPLHEWGELLEASAPELQAYFDVLKQVGSGVPPTQEVLATAAEAVKGKKQPESVAEATAMYLCGND